MDRTAELIRRSQDGDKEARETLIQENMGLVHHVVRRFLGSGGRGFDPDRGYRSDEGYRAL